MPSLTMSTKYIIGVQDTMTIEQQRQICVKNNYYIEHLRCKNNFKFSIKKIHNNHMRILSKT